MKQDCVSQIDGVDNKVPNYLTKRLPLIKACISYFIYLCTEAFGFPLCELHLTVEERWKCRRFIVGPTICKSENMFAEVFVIDELD